MKANELMIGDYISVKPSGMPIKVAAVHHKKVAYHTVINKLAWVRESLLEPIHLTPEILENNGFTKELDADGLHYWFTLIDEHTKFSILYARSAFQWLGPLDFKYVHELQHALKLCGIKKEIEL